MFNRLEDLDFADDLCLLSETHGDMQRKLEDLTNNPEKTGLVVNVKETMTINTHTKKDQFTLGVKVLNMWTSLYIWQCG